LEVWVGHYFTDVSRDRENDRGQDGRSQGKGHEHAQALWQLANSEDVVGQLLQYAPLGRVLRPRFWRCVITAGAVNRI
jgi:hypothetical protein